MGDWFRTQIEEAFHVEREGWAPERARRVAERLQADRPPEQRLEAVVVWLDVYNAFTTDGQTVYVTRRLLELCPDDDSLAFILAHEIAHHRLDHVGRRPRLWLLRLALERLGGRSSERELDADRLGIELCLRAGYDPERCLRAIALLRIVALDYGDLTSALRPDGGDRGGARRWWSRRTVSHLSLDEREEALRAHVRQLRRASAKTTASSGHPYRSGDAAEACGVCAAAACAACAGCAKRLCPAHAHPSGSCPACGGEPEPLCIPCRRAPSCHACGAPRVCRYCPSGAEHACTGCERIFCARHRPRSGRCGGCELDELLAEPEPPFAGGASLLGAAVVATIVVLLFAHLGVGLSALGLSLGLAFVAAVVRRGVHRARRRRRRKARIPTRR